METLRSLINEFAILRLTGSGFKNPTSFNRNTEEEIEDQDLDDPIKFDRADSDNSRVDNGSSDGAMDVDPTNGCNCKCCQKWHNFFDSLYDVDNNEVGDERDEENVWSDKNGNVNELKYKETPEDDEIEDEYLPASWPH